MEALYRKRSFKQAMVVLVMSGLVLAVAGVARAGHTPCDNEPIPQDIPVNGGNPPLVHVGVDTGLNNGWRAVCVDVVGIGGYAYVSPQTTGTNGAAARAGVCNTITGCTGVEKTGAETGDVSGATVDPTVWTAGSPNGLGKTGVEEDVAVPTRTEGTEITCVLTQCVKGQKVTAGSVTVWALGENPVPLCVSVGPGVSCP